MATIKANAHANLVEFLKEVAKTASTAGQGFKTDQWGRIETPRRAFSAFPAVDMTSAAVTFNAGALHDGWLYAAVTPKRFGEFLSDFQAQVQAGHTPTEFVYRNSLKPYCCINVKFGNGAGSTTPRISPAMPAPSITTGTLAPSELFTFSGSSETDYDYSIVETNPPAGVSISTGGVVTVAAGSHAGVFHVKAVHKTQATVTATAVITVVDGGSPAPAPDSADEPVVDADEVTLVAAPAPDAPAAKKRKAKAE